MMWMGGGSDVDGRRGVWEGADGDRPHGQGLTPRRPTPAGWIPAFAGMTWVGAGMMWVGAGVMWIGRRGSGREQTGTVRIAKV